MPDDLQALDPAVQQLARWADHPDMMVRELFGAEPDAWQDEALKLFPHSPRLAMKACKGPGKTTLLAWLCWNFLLTRPLSNIAATSITEANLVDGLRKEMALWRDKAPILQASFKMQGMRIVNMERADTWWMSFRTWSRDASPEQQGNTLAGLHANFVMAVIDEAGDVPISVLTNAEAVLGSCIEGHVVIAGNPTQLHGPIHHACVTARGDWDVIEITGDPDSPMRSPRIDVRWASAMIRQWGRDHPFVRINVLGMFPLSALNALLGADEVTAAQKRPRPALKDLKGPKLLGVDVALQGDDASVISPRRGKVAFKQKFLRSQDPKTIASEVKTIADSWHADAILVDNTGGWGSAVIMLLKEWKYWVIPIGFAEAANDRDHYANRRAEMHWELAQWVKDGGCLPEVPELVAELTTPTYTRRKNQILLESKDDIKKRLGRSPDRADALALTFAEHFDGGILSAAQWRQWEPKVRPGEKPEPPDCDELICSIVIEQGDDNITRWQWMVFGTFSAPGTSRPSAILLSQATGTGVDALCKELHATRKVQKTYLLWKDGENKPVRTELMRHEIMPRQTQTPGLPASVDIAGQMLHEGQVWAPAGMRWARRVQLDLDRWPDGDNSLLVAAFAQAMVYVKHRGYLDEPEAPSEPEMRRRSAYA